MFDEDPASVPARETKCLTNQIVSWIAANACFPLFCLDFRRDCRKENVKAKKTRRHADLADYSHCAIVSSNVEMEQLC